MARQLLDDTRKNGGLAPVDLERFWRDQAAAIADPLAAEQCAFDAILTWECAFDELGEPQDWWRYLYADEPWALDIARRYNDRAEQIVGRRIVPETPVDRSREWPAIKELYDIFEAENVWEGGASGSWWLKQSAHSPGELSALLDRVDRRLENLRDFLFPDTWETEKARLTALGERVPLYRHQRGPCTFACSIFGAEELLLLFYDDPALFRRFGEVIGRAILERARVIDAEAGYDSSTAPRGWSWADDNSCLFNPGMYEEFAMPIHRAVFARYAPDLADKRYQHSDSAMGHLLPQLGSVNLTGTNFGPTLTVSEIRRHLPNAVIRGQLAPFTYSRNDEERMVLEFLRDFEQAKERRGLVFTTAGSINNGSRLTGMRLLMAAVQRFGQYPGGQ